MRKRLLIAMLMLGTLAGYVTVALLLSSCGASLHTHARIAEATGELIDGAGAVIEQSASEQYDQVRASGGDLEQIKARYAPIEGAYRTAKDAHKAYVDAIWRSLKQGDKSLMDAPTRTLTAAWATLVSVGRALGLDLEKGGSK